MPEQIIGIDELFDFPEGIAAMGGVFEGVESPYLGEDTAFVFAATGSFSIRVTNDDLALMVEREYPELNDRLVSAIQLARLAPDVVHFQHLLHFSVELPRIARAAGVTADAWNRPSLIASCSLT